MSILTVTAAALALVVRPMPPQPSAARVSSPVMMRGYSVSGYVAAACAAVTIGLSPLALTAKDVPAELQLENIGRSSLVEAGLKDAGMEGDLKMIKLWTRLKVGEIEVEGQKAAEKVSDEQSLAAARMRVRSLQPYLDEAQRDIFASKCAWASQTPASQTPEFITSTHTHTHTARLLQCALR